LDDAPVEEKPMHRKFAMAAVSGAAALSAFVLPTAAQAAPAVGSVPNTPRIEDVVVNEGKNVVLGDPTQPHQIPVTVTAQAKAGIESVDVALWHGKSFDAADAYLLPSDSDCVKVNATTTTCTEVLEVSYHDWANSYAGTWHVDVHAMSASTSHEVTDANRYANVKVQRESSLSLRTSKEQVKDGGGVLVTGTLDRADWETGQSAGYAGVTARLQFRREGSRYFTTVRTVRSASTGSLQASVKPEEDGYWRWSYSGDRTTAAATSAPQFVAAG
jgi:hypothetical protein